LHCSPSFSLSQSFDIITPRPGTDTPQPAPVNPRKPWSQLFKGSNSISGIPPPRPPPWHASSSARPPQPPLITAHSIGTPPSVEPKLHQAAERTFSIGSLRKGPLSFSSHGQRSNSCTRDGAASDLSFAPEVSADVPPVDAVDIPLAAASQDCGVHSNRRSDNAAVRATLPPPRPPIPPLRTVRPLRRQLSAMTPRSTPRSGLENCFHCAARPMLPLATTHQDVLDRYWSSQREETPLHCHGPSDTPRPSHPHSHVEETASVADAPVRQDETPRTVAPSFFAPSDLNPASAQSSAAMPMIVFAVPPPPQRNGHGRASRRSAGGRPPRQTKGGAMLAKGGLLSRRRSRCGSGDDVQLLPTQPKPPDVPSVQLPSPRLLLRPRISMAAPSLPAAPERDRDRDCVPESIPQQNDSWRMPAPPARRSRGAHITGLAMGSRQRPVPLPAQPSQTPPAQSSRGKSNRNSCASGTNIINNSSTRTSKSSAGSTSTVVATAPSAPSRTPLLPRELPNLAGNGRPELSRSLPVCHVLNIVR
jgi:hypothetical protein